MKYYKTVPRQPYVHHWIRSGLLLLAQGLTGSPGEQDPGMMFFNLFDMSSLHEIRLSKPLKRISTPFATSPMTLLSTWVEGHRDRRQSSFSLQSSQRCPFQAFCPCIIESGGGVLKPPQAGAA